MVKCTNGIYTFYVTEGAYDSYYKPQGYRAIATEDNVSVQKEIVLDEPDDDGDDFDNLMEKPISQWTKQEVKDFAAAKDIDISNTRNVGQAKEVIKEYLSSVAG